MTTRKSNRKPAVKPAVKFDAIASAKIIGDNLGQAAAAADVLGAATIKINEQVKAMRGAKVKIGGSRRTCPVAAAVYDAMPAHLMVGTKNNYLTAIRAAVNGKADFQFPNGSAKAKAAKAKAKAKAKGAKAGGGTIMIAISSGAKAKDAAAKLRAGFNKMKDSGDELAKLAAFLIDALDDAGHAAESE
jgi:hypothetical protein